MPKSADMTAAGRTAIAPAMGSPAPGRLENVSLPAKIFLPASETEIDCVVTDLCLEDATISVARKFDISAEVVLYIEGFDRFSAVVVRSSQDLTRVKFNASAHKRERTAEKIAAYLRGKPLSRTKLRRNAPSPIASARTFHLPNGSTADFEVIDISLLGASLRTRCRPLVGEIVTIGTTEGRVARYIDNGIVIEFIRPNARAVVEVGESLP